MNTPNTARQLPGTSANPAECMVPSCHERVGVWFGNVLAPTVQEAVFGAEFKSDLLAVCRHHYKYLRTRDGVSLGYRRTADGKTVAYIKDESF